MMTNQETELRTALRPWTDRAVGVIERRLEDARLHAAAGKLPAGNRRLTELYGSLLQHVSDAKASFYRQAFQQHSRAGLDPEIHQLGLGPDQYGETAARVTPILGSTYANQALDAMADVEAALTSATLADQAGGPGGGSFLQNWADQHRDRLVSLTARELSTAQIAIFEAVGQILIKPELR
jgi:hypothetical protein